MRIVELDVALAELARVPPRLLTRQHLDEAMRTIPVGRGALVILATLTLRAVLTVEADPRSRVLRPRTRRLALLQLLPRDDIVLIAERTWRTGRPTHLREHSQLKMLSEMREGEAPRLRDVSASWDEFERLELIVGRITEVQDFPEARQPAYKLTIDFGPRGARRSSAQITHYAKSELLGRQVVCVLGFEPKRIAGFKSEVLVTGAVSDRHGIVLLRPDRDVEDGSAIG